MTTIVLTHGAFHGGWCFAPLIDELERQGITCLTPELPLTDLNEDVAAVHAVLDACDGPVTLLGHSYGGAVVTVAGSHPNVERLVLLAALAPDVGENASGGPVEIGVEFMSALRFSEEGVTSVDPELAAQVFYPDADTSDAAHWATRLRPGNTGGVVLVPVAAWHEVPTTYIVCADDPIVLPTGQRALAARVTTDVREIAGDHSPMVCRPAELASMLTEIMS
jgi:pimeloyl-ACP methyl ester carboxylesterase